MSPRASSIDPVAIASRDFATARKGFDKDEVRRYLRSLSDAVRELEKSSAGAEDLEEARRQVRQLTAERDDLESRLAQAEAEQANSDRTPAIDDKTVMQFLGEETARVLETARSAASDIKERAEAEAAARIGEIDRVQASANAEVAEMRRQASDDVAELRSTAAAEVAELRRSTDEEIAALRTAAEAEAEKRTADAEASAQETLAEADRIAAEVREQAETDAARIRAEAEADAAEMRDAAAAEQATVLAAAAAARADAETDAARIRAEAEADAMTSHEAAAETARQMVTEAQAVREKVLSDLVTRRRLGRQQIDQAKAARDRLHQALVATRKDLDAQLAELEIALPEAKAAMDAIAQQAKAVNDAAQIKALEVELDAGSAGGIELPEEIPHVSSGAAALGTLRESDRPTDPGVRAGGAPVDDDVVDDAAADQAAVDEQAAGDESGPERGTSVFDRLRAADESAEGGDDVAADADGRHSEDESGEGGGADAGSSAGDADGGDGEAEGDAESEAEEIEVPEPFVQRDVAMTRHGADLRRKIKRAMADDQSELLDRLRRAKRMSVDDLPPVEEQRAPYVAAIAPALKAAARAGADMAGGKVAESSVDALVDRVMGAIFEPLRHRVEQSVTGAEGDADEVLEPIRAHYRDLRSSEVPSVTDDALAEAFALGAYEALGNGTPVKWIADPRMEPNPDCFDNTLAGVITKPDPFPTGRKRPEGEPGCRCLVVAATD
jgi:cell division septum initiation protein DivIVA